MTDNDAIWKALIADLRQTLRKYADDLGEFKPGEQYHRLDIMNVAANADWLGQSEELHDHLFRLGQHHLAAKVEVGLMEMHRAAMRVIHSQEVNLGGEVGTLRWKAAQLNMRLGRMTGVGWVGDSLEVVPDTDGWLTVSAAAGSKGLETAQVSKWANSNPPPFKCTGGKGNWLIDPETFAVYADEWIERKRKREEWR